MSVQALSRTARKKNLQKMFWIYLTNNFVVTSMDDFKTIELSKECGFLPLTLDNYFRVLDFREENRVSEYRRMLAHKEIGFFAGVDGKMVGSIWATINTAQLPSVVRS